MNFRFLLFAAAMLCLPFSLVWSQSEQIYLKSTVTGNQEQPTVSYIIPWQAPASTEEFQIRLGPSFIQDTFEHIDAKTLAVQIELRERLAPASEQLLENE